MIKDLTILVNALKSRSLIAEANAVANLIKKVGSTDNWSSMSSSKESELRESLKDLNKKLSSLPKWSERNKSEEALGKELQKELFKVKKRLHEIAPEKEPFKKPEERVKLKEAIKSYIKKLSTHLTKEEKNKIEIVSLNWIFDDGYFWEVAVREPGKDEDANWLIWYGKSKEDIYDGPTESFEIDGAKYHLAGEL